MYVYVEKIYRKGIIYKLYKIALCLNYTGQALLITYTVSIGIVKIGIIYELYRIGIIKIGD